MRIKNDKIRLQMPKMQEKQNISNRKNTKTTRQNNNQMQIHKKMRISKHLTKKSLRRTNRINRLLENEFQSTYQQNDTSDNFQDNCCWF